MDVLLNLVGSECRIFIDDIIFSTSAEEHALGLENVLQMFDEANLQLHPGKCVFAKTKVQYLCFVLHWTTNSKTFFVSVMKMLLIYFVCIYEFRKGT
jgi:hypothetical protein